MKKTISILLVVCIIFSGVVPHTVYANDEGGENSEPIPFVQKNPETYWSNQDVTITLTDDEAEAVFYQSKETSDETWPALIQYNAPLIYSQDESSYIINAVSKDENGATLQEENGITVNIDKTPPTLSVQVNNPVWTRDDVEISFEAQDNFSGVNRICLQDGTTVATADSNPDDDKFTSSCIVSDNGDYTYYAVDNAGNKSGNIQVTVSRIDKNSPTDAPGFVNPPESSSWVEEPVYITLSWQDKTPDDESQERPRYSFDNNTWEDYTVPIEVTGEGTHTVYAVTKDLAGNKSEIVQTTVNIDNDKPLLSATGISSVWTNNDVVVTLNASDTASGVAGIYSSDGTELTTSSSIERTFTENTQSAEVFYAMDNSGKKSDDYQLSIENIDKSDPSAPTMSLSSSDWTYNNVVIELSKVIPAENQSPEKRQYSKDDGLTWIDYENFGQAQGTEDSFEVSDEGSYAVKARTIDEAGNTSIENSVTVKIDKTYPVIENISYTPDEVNSGKGSVTVDISDVLSGIYEKKYSIGEKPASFFDEENNGTDIVGSSFVIDGANGGEYTIYAKDNAGNVTVVNVHDKIAEINTYPLIDSIPLQEINEDAGKQNLDINGISDNETTDYDNLTVVFEYSGTILKDVALTDDDNNGIPTLTYTPKDNKFGEDSIMIHVSDDNETSLTTSREVKISVKAVDDVPYAVDDTKDVQEGEVGIEIDVRSNDSDVEGDVSINNFDVLSIKAGTVIKNIAGNGLIYTPENTNFSGVDTFTYDVIDETGNVSNTATVTINVQNQNDLPLAVDDNHEMDEDQTISLDVLHNDTDNDLEYVDEEILIISIIDFDDTDKVVVFDDSDDENPLDPDTSVNVEHGVITYDSVNRNLVFKPDSHYHGTFDFNYTITDMAGETSQANVNINVVSVNDVPEFSGLNDPPTYTFDEDTEIYDINFSISDVELPNANSLTIRAISKTTSIISNSQIELLNTEDVDGATTLRIRPSADIFGDATIQMDLSDGNDVTTINLTINILNVNDAPVAKAYEVEYVEDSYVIFDLDDYKKSDSDIDNTIDELTVKLDQASIDAINTTTQGTLEVESEADNTYRFTPVQDYDGDIELDYIISDSKGNADGEGKQDANIITLTAIQINDGPSVEQAVTNVYETNEDVSKGIIPDNLENFNKDDYDLGDLLMFTFEDVDNTSDELKITFKSSNEELILSENISYAIAGDTILAKINPNANQPDSEITGSGNFDTSLISVTVSDGERKDSTSFTFKVYPEQDNPVAVDGEVVVEFNGFSNVYPLENDYDFDVPDIIFIQSAVPQADKGTVTISDDNLYLYYVAKANFKGQDIITYTINDGKGNTDTGQITVTVGAENITPKIDNILDAWDYEDPESPTTIGFTVTDEDTTGYANMSFEFASNNLGLIDPSVDGSIAAQIDENGNVILSLQPKADQFGNANITVKVIDEFGAFDTDTFEYRVYSVNDAPVPVIDYYLIDEDRTNYTDKGTNVTTEVIIDPLANDTDVDNENDELSLISITGLKHGYLEFLGDNKFKYHPDAHFNDTRVELPDVLTETLTYVVSDGNEQETGTVKISVEAINDTPRARSVYRVVGSFDDPNHSLVINDKGDFDIRKNDYDIEDTYQHSLSWNTFTIVKINGTAVADNTKISTTHGNVDIDENGVMTYTRKDNGEDGDRETDQFTYTIRDSEGGEGTAIVYIATYFNDHIWVNNHTVTINEDSDQKEITVSYHVPSNIGPYTVTHSQPSKGTINSYVVNDDLEDSEDSTSVTFYYTPSLDKNGSDSFTYTVTDGDNVYEQKIGTVNVNILPVNDDPKFVDWDATNNDPTNSVVTTTNTVDNPIASITMDEDSTSDWYTVIFQDNKDWENDDIDGLNNEDLTFELTIGATVGEPIIVEDGIEVIRIEDEEGVTVDDSYSAARFRFTSIANRSGTVPITIKVSDGESTVTSTFDLNVSEINDPPYAPNFTETIAEDSKLTEILVNTGSDLEDKDNVILAIPIIASGQTIGNTSKGTVELLDDNKTVVYTPNHDETGSDSFTYTITDKTGETKTSTGTVAIDITPINDNPSISGYQYTYTQLEDNNIEIMFTAEDIDNDSDELDYEIGSFDGSLIESITPTKTIVGDQVVMKFVVKPVANKNGSDSLTIKVKDNNEPEQGYVDLEFLLKFEPANDRPVAVDDPSVLANDYYQVDEDTPTDLNVLENDNDIDEGSVLHITEIILPDGFEGKVSINNDETIKYTPPENFYCADGEVVAFEYTVSDQFGGSDTADVRIKVESINDEPVAGNDKVTIDEDTQVTIDVLANDFDVEGDNITIVLNESGSGAWHTGGEKAKSIEVVDEKIVYTPKDDENGVDTFEYKTSDGNNGFDTATVTVTVNSIIDNPIPLYDEQNSSEFVIYEDISKEYNIHYTNKEETYKDILFTTHSTNETIIKDNGILVEKIIKEGAGEEDIWIKMTFDSETNMNTGSLDPNYININITKQVGPKEFIDVVPMYVLPVNDSPIITSINHILSTNENSSVSGNVQGTDQETIKSALRYFAGANENIDVKSFDPYSEMGGDNIVEIDSVNGGKVKVNTVTGEYVFTPKDEDFTGVDSFWVYVDDGFRETDDFNINGTIYPRQDASATAAKKVTVTVNPVNDPPVAVNDAAGTVEDTPVDITVKSNDDDVDDDVDDLTVIKVTNPANGTVALVDGVFTYTPDANFNGDDTFKYKLNDGKADSASATVTVTITPVDDNPEAFNDAKSIAEDSDYVEVDVLDNDINPDRSDFSAPEYTELIIMSFEDENGDMLTQGKTANGSVKIEDNKLLYKPDENFEGADSFNYKINDGDGDTDTAEVVITITPVNDPPVAEDDEDETYEEQPIRIAVKTNDSDIEDVDNVDLTLIIIQNPANGTAEIKDDGEIKYTPKDNFAGIDTFTYKVEDTGGLTSNLATVTITVKSLNDVPIAVDDDYSVPEDTFDNEIDVLDNDENPDRSDLNLPEKTGLSIVSFEDGNGDITTEGEVDHGYVKIVDNKLYYTPDADYEGMEYFSYTIRDQDGDEDTADVTLTVVPGEEIPEVTIPNSFSGIQEDQPVPFEVNLNPYVYDQDDGDNWDIVFESNASHGTADFDKSTKILAYSPNANYNGTDSITIQVDDGINKVPAKIEFEITPVNDMPVAEDNSARGDEDTPIIIDVITNDHDIDNNPLLNTHESCVPDVLSILESGISGVDHGTVAIDGNNIIFTPEFNWFGVEIFTYTVEDSAGKTSTANVEVTIDYVEDGVQVNPSPTSKILEDGGATEINVLDLVTKPDEDTIESFKLADGQELPPGLVLKDGKIMYTPLSDFNGVIEFWVEFTLGSGEVVRFKVPLTVEPVNDPAVAVDDFRQTKMGTAVDVPILVNDIEIDTDELLNAEPDSLEVHIVSQPENGTAGVLESGSGSLVGPASFSRNRYNADQLKYISLVASTSSFENGIIPVVSSDVLNQIEIRYTPNPGFYGIDTFVYGFYDSDTNNTLVQATVTIEILNEHYSVNQVANPKTGYYVFEKIREFFGLN